PFQGRYELKTTNVLDIDYPDQVFDFTHCAGVLMATPDIYRGLTELARITRPGGMLCISVYGKGGLVRDVTTWFRRRYVEDPALKSLIENLTVETFDDFFEWTV